MNPLRGHHTFRCQMRMRVGKKCNCDSESAEKESKRVDTLHQRIRHLETLLNAHHKISHRRQMDKTGTCTICKKYYSDKDADINAGKFV